MKTEYTIIKKVLATIFSSINEQNRLKGINIEYKYSMETELIEGEKFKKVQIITKELGYGEKTLQEFRYKCPPNLDKFTIEYNVVLDVMKTLAEGSLVLWEQLGKELNTDKEFQKTAINIAKNGKKNSTDTD